MRECNEALRIPDCHAEPELCTQIVKQPLDVFGIGLHLCRVRYF